MPPGVELGMTENSSDSLPFESPDEENRHLRVENAQLRRILTVHGIPAPSFTTRSSLPAKAAETVTWRKGGARSEADRTLSEPVSRERRRLRTALGECRWPVG